MAIRKCDYHPPAESLLARVGRVIAVGPFRVFLGADLMPQGDESGIAHEFRRVTLHVMPEAGVQRRGEDVHEAVVERFAAGLRVQLLRVAGAGADDGVGVVAGMDNDLPNSLEIGNLAAKAEGEINPRLGLVFGGMLLGIGIEYLAARLPRRRQWNIIRGARTAKHPSNDPILAFVDWGRAFLAPHGAVHRFDSKLAGMGRRVGLPASLLSK